jgi:vacuolar-type H+-ATPase subunit H
MFKALSNFLHRTPWWALILLGLATIVFLGVFTVPFQVMRLEKAGATPEINRAIKREIDTAFAHQGLDIAESFVQAFKERTKDPERRAELESALAEIARARHDMQEVVGAIADAKREATNAMRDAEKESRRAIDEAAAEARAAARESLVAAREAGLEGAKAILEGQREALRAFRDTGLKDGRVEKELESGVKAAEQNVKKAERQLETARTSKNQLDIGIRIGKDKPAIRIEIDDSEEGATAPAPPAPPVTATPAKPAAPAKPASPASPATPAIPAPPAKPAKPASPDSPKMALAPIPPKPPLAPLAPLAPELRADIHEKVADDFYRLGIGAGMIMLFIPLFIMAIIAKFFIDRARGAQRVAEVKKKEADFHSMHRQVTEAKLQALQAQVEPHFLYNTLANVQALTEADPAQANKMVEHLIQYLRSALPKMRENSSTVGQELELVRAYLNILKMRMGARLEFSIEAAEHVAKLPFPPLMLPSLVENAIKHGLEPQREGGRIDIVATVTNGIIKLEVKDTGRGFGTGTAGGGVGLANIRERLQALFGNAGKLALTENQPRGVIATLEVPESGPGQPMPAKSAAPSTPPTMTSRVWGGVKTVHGVWAKVATFTFMTVMVVLGVLFGVALVGTFTGWFPFQIGGTQVHGPQGAALGTVALVLLFGVLALVALILVAVFYGLGVMFAGLVVFIPIVILISLMPALAPFILIGLAVWWYLRKKRKERERELPNLKI